MLVTLIPVLVEMLVTLIPVPVELADTTKSYSFQHHLRDSGNIMESFRRSFLIE